MQFPAPMQAQILEAFEMGDASNVKDMFLAEKRRTERILFEIIEHDVDPMIQPTIDDPEVMLPVITMFQKHAGYQQLAIKRPDTALRIDRWKRQLTQLMIQNAMLAAQFEGGGGQSPEGEAQPQPDSENNPTEENNE